MRSPKLTVSLSLLSLALASLALAACSGAASPDGSLVQRRSDTDTDVDPTEGEGSAKVPSRSSAPAESAPPSQPSTAPAPATPATPPATPAPANACATPKCFGLAGVCGCQGKGSDGIPVVLACSGGQCQCVGGSSAQFAGDCASTADALDLFATNCGCQ